MGPTTPRFAELPAAAHWRVVDFISDLHLQADEAATRQAWERYLARTRADAVFILGDLFEVWVGDDALTEPTSFEAHCAEVLRQASAQRAVYFLHGNRDFLLGPAFARAVGGVLLPDPTVLAFGARRWLLTHGDALCLADTDYQHFRAQVRSPHWQQDFLARSLAERQAMARDLRARSEARKRDGTDYADVDAEAARHWLQDAGADTLIHGHTHRPADHDLGAGLNRHVLSDWELTATPPRAEVLRLSLAPDGTVRTRRLAPDAAAAAD